VRFLVYIIALLFITKLYGQYPPPAGQPGSTAIHADSSIINFWASKCYVQRGYINICNKSLGTVTYGNESDAIGKADNQVISLGDSGIAVLKFPVNICDKNGFDFVIFENSFNGQFLELAFVEISNDSVHWFRFPSVSLTPVDQQIETFGTIQAEHIHNLAGKYIVMYGTPFDISDIPDNPYLDKQNIKYIKIIDVIGNIEPPYISYDSQGNIINDPFPTPFHTGGFDLDAVGVINYCTDGVNKHNSQNITIYPNPATDYLYISSEKNIVEFYIVNFTGVTVIRGIFEERINIQQLPAGIYTIFVISEKQVYNKKFVKNWKKFFLY